jgi:adenylyltransferase/sulfurtransferase
LILGKGKPLSNQLLIYDALGVDFRKVRVPKNKECPVCGENPTITSLTDLPEEYCEI